MSDPAFEFSVKEAGIDLLKELSKQDAGKRATLDAITAEVMGNFGAHNRNVVRGIMKAGAVR